ncbi:MAG: hypothetical protein COV46_08565 [Deltaproteobacteria bacterium CG11_big_fil_rev_8_21_14_0_20_49_13]|nr:MAG: hypothetical protein COV46_08565 [Deltaproteobacteria bacterium CG11_big_fil_rev_8_21_14_0_20_49_13]
MSFKRCIILLADGSKHDVLSELIAQGQLPNINKELLAEGSIRRAVTVFPSTTGPAHIPYLTGCLPATCNVPGIRWFDKKLYHNFGHGSVLSFGSHGRYRSYVGVETFRINSDMRNDIYNVFEILPRSYSIFNSINRGVGKRNLTKIMRMWYWYYGHLTDRWKFVDGCGFKKAMKVAKKDIDFLFAVLPGIDEYSHMNHPKHGSTIEQYKFFDNCVGELIGQLKADNKWDDTLFFIVSDHGLSATHTHFCVNTFLEDRGIKTFYFPLIYRKDCAAASMVSGNGMTHIYFRKEEGWSGHATIEDINSMYPGLLKELLAEPAVDVIAMRDRENNIVVWTKRGRAKVKMEGDRISYFVKEQDPFGYPFDAARTTLHSSREMLSSTIDSDYPDAPYQLAHIFTSPRCGDLVVSATPGYDLRVKYENPEHRSSHGSLHKEHMIVPVISNIKLPDVPMRTVDIFPTYLKLMGYEAPENIDGINLN